MNILGYFNLDMTGYLAPGYEFRMDLVHYASSQPLANYYFNICDVYFPEIPVESYYPQSGSSDYASFNNFGYMAIHPHEDYNTYNPYIHSPADTINLSVNNPEQCRVFTQINLASIATLAGILHETDLPIPAFKASETTIVEGDTVQFTDLSLNNPIEWQWYFEGGDPKESTEQHPEVVYENPGKYDVKLIVTNEHGCDSLTLSNCITVKMLPPIADFEADVTTIEEGETVTFINLSQQKPESFSWFFEGGTPQQSNLENPPVVLYKKAGTYPVRLTAKNEGGESTEIKDDYIIVKPKTAITDISTGSIAIYPNPTNGEFRVQSLKFKVMGIEIFDVLGRKVQSLTFNVQSSEFLNFKPEKFPSFGGAGVVINISNLPSGIYFVRIKTETDVVIRKVVKM
jgi:PKD repeat protein